MQSSRVSVNERTERESSRESSRERVQEREFKRVQEKKRLTVDVNNLKTGYFCPSRSAQAKPPSTTTIVRKSAQHTELAHRIAPSRFVPSQAKHWCHLSHSASSQNVLLHAAYHAHAFTDRWKTERERERKKNGRALCLRWFHHH
jgi:hypothetical protein